VRGITLDVTNSIRQSPLESYIRLLILYTSLSTYWRRMCVELY